MRVRNLQAWAGVDFSFVAGDEVELEDEIALARIEAGLAEPITETRGRRRRAAETETETQGV